MSKLSQIDPQEILYKILGWFPIIGIGCGLLLFLVWFFKTLFS